MDTRSEVTTLRARWTKTQLATLNRSLRDGRVESPFGMVAVDGRRYADARGARVTGHVERPARGVDLSYCVRDPGVQFMAEMRRCRLAAADLRTNVGDHLVDCDLSGANLRGASLWGRFERCRFARANLWKADGVGVRFVRCDFTDATLTAASLYDGVFDRCVWERTKFGRGSVAGSRFLGSRPSTRALGDTILESDEDDV